MATYAGFALLGPVLGPADFRMAAFLVDPAWTIPLPSGGTWPVDFGALFLLVGLTALAFETLKTARAGGRTLGYRLLAILWLDGRRVRHLGLPPADRDGRVRRGVRIAGAAPEQPPGGRCAGRRT